MEKNDDWASVSFTGGSWLSIGSSLTPKSKKKLRMRLLNTFHNAVEILPHAEGFNTGARQHRSTTKGRRSFSLPICSCFDAAGVFLMTTQTKCARVLFPAASYMVKGHCEVIMGLRACFGRCVDGTSRLGQRVSSGRFFALPLLWNRAYRIKNMSGSVTA